MADPPTPLQIDYIDPDGNDWDLSDRGMVNGYVCAGISGIDGLPVSMQTIPLLDGTAIPNFYIPQPGTINLALLIEHPNENEDQYYQLLDRVARAFYNRRRELPAPASIAIQRPDGTSRQIEVWTTSGLDTPEVGVHNCLFTFTMQTPDPYWYESTPQEVIYRSNIAAGILPLLPIPLGSGSIFGDAIITPGGNMLSWPIWTITGPGTPVIKNLTTGRQWSLSSSIPSGNVVQVVTKPGEQMVVNQTTGVNIWDQLVLSTLRDLWPLVGGDNRVNIAMTGATSSTSVQIDWYNRWSRA